MTPPPKGASDLAELSAGATPGRWREGPAGVIRAEETDDNGCRHTRWVAELYHCLPDDRSTYDAAFVVALVNACRAGEIGYLAFRPDPAPVVDDAEASFTDYFVRNYPGPDTIIHDPHWHAPRIFRAARVALQAARPAAGTGDVPDECPMRGHDLPKRCPKCDAKHNTGCPLEAYFEKLYAAPQPDRAPGDGGWQPIETAPKDGTPVLVACPPETTGRPWFIDAAQNFYEVDESAHPADEWTARESNQVVGLPTHWRSLPTSPAAPQPGRSETGEGR